MLDPVSRSAIIALSVLCVLGAILLAPSRARGSLDLAATHLAVDGDESHSAAPVARIDIQRDPFASEPTPAPAPLAVSVPAPTVPAMSRTDIGPLPNNLGTDTIPVVPPDAASITAAPHVTAIVTGAHPYAMLDTAGNHEIKGIGDNVGGKPIIAIDLDGVTLAGGQRLMVAPGESAR